jgi:hypothetical protein
VVGRDRFPTNTKFAGITPEHIENKYKRLFVSQTWSNAGFQLALGRRQACPDEQSEGMAAAWSVETDSRQIPNLQE